MPFMQWKALSMPTAKDDEVLDCKEMVTHNAGCRQTVTPTGGHTFAGFADYVADILAFGAARAN